MKTFLSRSLAIAALLGPANEAERLASVDLARRCRQAAGEAYARRADFWDAIMCPESLLVVVIITDEDDVQDGCDGMVCDSYGSGGTKEEWFAELLSYRNNIPENIVVLALIGRKLDNPCGAVPASKLLGFTNLFGDNGFIGDVCADDYAPFFAEALPVIGNACANWVPPG